MTVHKTHTLVEKKQKLELFSSSIDIFELDKNLSQLHIYLHSYRKIYFNHSTQAIIVPRKSEILRNTSPQFRILSNFSSGELNIILP